MTGPSRPETGTPVSAQTRSNRASGGRKAAAFTKAKRARRDGEMGPDGPLRGSAPVAFSISETIARIRAAEAAKAAEAAGGG